MCGAGVSVFVVHVVGMSVCVFLCGLCGRYVCVWSVWYVCVCGP